MAPLVVPNAALVRLIWALSGVPYAVNVLGAQKTGGGDLNQDVANTLGAAIKAAFSSTGLNVAVGNTVSLSKVGLRDISAPNRPEFLDSGGPVTGTATGNLLPLQIAVCVTLRTASAGKSFRGRYYAGGFTVANNGPTGGMIGTLETVLVNWLNAIDAAMGASGLNLAVVSRRQLVTTPVSTIQVRDSVWDTIRGRATAGI